MANMWDNSLLQIMVYGNCSVKKTGEKKRFARPALSDLVTPACASAAPSTSTLEKIYFLLAHTTVTAYAGFSH